MLWELCLVWNRWAAHKISTQHPNSVWRWPLWVVDRPTVLKQEWLFQVTGARQERLGPFWTVKLESASFWLWGENNWPVFKKDHYCGCNWLTGSESGFTTNLQNVSTVLTPVMPLVRRWNTGNSEREARKGIRKEIVLNVKTINWKCSSLAIFHIWPFNLCLFSVSEVENIFLRNKYKAGT